MFKTTECIEETQLLTITTETQSLAVSSHSDSQFTSTSANKPSGYNNLILNQSGNKGQFDTYTAEPTPSEVVREQYYQSYDNSQESDTNSNQSSQDLTHSYEGHGLIARPEGAIAFAPLKPPYPFSIKSLSDTNSILSLKTCNETDDTRSNSSVRTNDSFQDKPRDMSTEDPKATKPNIVVEEEWTERDPDNRKSVSPMIGSSSLLSRLSKTTAPMRAKLSAISRSTNHLNLDRSHSTSLSIPLRRSAESIRDIAHLSLKSGNRAKGERSQSFSWDKSLLHDSFAQEEAPTIYAALLSKVAHAFKEHITLTTRVKDSLTYKDVFDGKEAVDKLSFLTKFTDRKLVLVLGRALEAQRFFHDVNYEHQLRDSVQELYHFKEHIHLPIPMTSTPEKEIQLSSEDLPIASSHTSIHVDDGLPNGIFTVLTRCYSPTCTQNKYCYSPLCPRLPNTSSGLAPLRVLHHYTSQSSITDQIEERLWISTVSKDVSQSISSEERKRQENMFELIYTEKDFVDDIAYLQTYWITPLLAGIEGSEKSYEPLVNELFWNIMEIHTVSEKLSESLLKLQSADPIIHRIGDTLLKHVVKFEPFVDYGAHQIISKYVLETEKSTNSDFSRFVEATERLPQSRKLELNGYLTKPTTRLGRYNLILREIVKHTSKDHPDQEDIPKVMKIISEFLSKVNEKTGKAENMFNLKMLREKLKMRNPSELKELALQSEQRKMIFKGPLKKKGTGSESSDMQVYLIDTCIIITKQKYVQNTEHHKIYKKPIPLALLALTLPDQTKRVASLLPYGRSSTGAGPVINSTEVVASNSNKGGHPISFAYLGRQGFGPITLYATTILARRQWVHKIEHQRLILTEKQKVFNVMTISEKFFNSLNRVNCAVTHGQSILIGSDQGVYMKKNNNDDIMVRLLAMEKVSQIDILEGSNLILVLADKILYTYSLDSLLSEDTSAKRGRKISSHVSFFKVGKVLEKTLLDKPSEKTLVCFVRYNAITSTIRALEPHTTGDTKKKNKPHLGLFMRGSNEGLKVYKDLYIPGEATSIQYFKNIICVGSAKGFQMVNIASAEVQSVLDPRDEGHNFILQKENLKPISMFRHPDGTILLCYNEIAFYIDKKGKRMRDEWIIQWEGAPTAFAFQFPYVIAFDSTFIEVRHMNTGELVQVIPGINIRCLSLDPTEIIQCVMEDRLLGCELIFELKHIC